MPSQFQLNIPTENAAPTNFILNAGESLFILGANGTGKSSLVGRLFNENQGHAKRISAHRQTWFESNTLDMTPRASTTLADSFELSLNAGSAMRASIGRRARQGENDEFSNGWERRLRRA